MNSLQKSSPFQPYVYDCRCDYQPYVHDCWCDQCANQLILQVQQLQYYVSLKLQVHLITSATKFWHMRICNIDVTGLLFNTQVGWMQVNVVGGWMIGRFGLNNRWVNSLDRNLRQAKQVGIKLDYVTNYPTQITYKNNYNN